MAGEPAVSQSKLGAGALLANSVQRTLKLLGVKGLQCRRATKNILEAARKA